jgi:hypothetical protein
VKENERRGIPPRGRFSCACALLLYCWSITGPYRPLLYKRQARSTRQGALGETSHAPLYPPPQPPPPPIPQPEEGLKHLTFFFKKRLGAAAWCPQWPFLCVQKPKARRHQGKGGDIGRRAKKKRQRQAEGGGIKRKGQRKYPGRANPHRAGVVNARARLMSCRMLNA